MSSDVVIVGAGIVGASIAYHLAAAGASVTLVDAGRPGQAVTARSFAWIGSSGTRTGPAAELRTIAADEYHRLETELPGLPVTWSGSLSWNVDEAAPEAGPGQEIVDAATVAALEPTVAHPPTWAVWAPGDGAIDPVTVTERLIADAGRHGARLHLDTPVLALRRDRAGRVTGVDTADGNLSGGVVVLAAAAASAALAAPLGVHVPVEPSPATLFEMRAPAGLIRGIVNTQDFDIRQIADDRLIAAADSLERTLAAARSTFRGAEGVEMLGARVGQRPMPVDGEPLIGPVPGAPGLYAAVMHPGVTLAPAVGRLIAAELITGVAERILAGCRLDRF